MTVEALLPAGAQPTAPDYQTRLAVVRAWLASHGLAAFVVISPENIYYLTGLDHLGYFAFTALLVPLDGPPIVVTREMERPTIAAQLPWCRHVTFRDGQLPAGVVGDTLAGLVPAGGGLAAEDATMFFPPLIRERIRQSLGDRRWMDGTALLAELRAVKSPIEIEHMRRAARVSDAAMSAGLAAARPGASEREVAAAVQHAMYAHGGQQPGFVPLIRPLSLLAQEHVSWADRPLTLGTGLFLELSGCVARYHAPCSRTVYIGSVSPGEQLAHARALSGLAAALDALRPGVPTGQVYAAWRHAVAEAGIARHHCGYLVGIGFPPSWVGGGEVLGIRPDGDVIIEPGMTFHLMSWVNHPSGHVVSDTALVTETGAELLTTTSRELLVVI